MRTFLATFFGSWILLGLADAQTTNGGAAPWPDIDYASFGVKSLADLHGMNFGNFLEAPKEGMWGETFQEDYFPVIKKAGFNFVRVPVRWSGHIGPAPDYKIDPTFQERVDWVLANCEKNKLVASLDYHNDEEVVKDPDAYADRYVKIWKQVAKHYKNAPPSIFFELMNEPHDKLDDARWNALLVRALAAVRASNPTRTVVVGPTRWNGISKLQELVLPESDRNLLVTVHYYDPMTFTHQGAEWIGPASQGWMGTKWGSDADKQAVVKDFNTAAAWGKAHHRPMYLGEFGAFSKSPIEGRAQWTAFVARAAESHGMPWTYWEFCDGFGAYDKTTKTWREPLLDALHPEPLGTLHGLAPP
jgi:endoglucanase